MHGTAILATAILAASKKTEPMLTAVINHCLDHYYKIHGRN